MSGQIQDINPPEIEIEIELEKDIELELRQKSNQLPMISLRLCLTLYKR